MRRVPYLRTAFLPVPGPLHLMEQVLDVWDAQMPGLWVLE